MNSVTSSDYDWLAADGYQLRSVRWNDFVTQVMTDVWWKHDSPDTAKFAWYATDLHKNSAKMVHGGAVMTYLDHCMGALCYLRSGGQFAHTIQMSTQFLKPIRLNRWVHCHVRHSAGDGAIQLLEAEVSVGSRPVAKAHGTFVNPVRRQR